MTDAPRRYRVLITRPAADARALAVLLRASGIDSVVEPLFRIVIDRTAPPPRLDGAQAIVVTSANGVRALEHHPVPRDLPVFAVGDATARQATRAGFQRVESASGDVVALGDLVCRRLAADGGAVVHIAGSAVAGDLAGVLRAAGFCYRRAVLYRTEASARLRAATRRALTEHALDAVALYSPRTGGRFVDLLARDNLIASCRCLTIVALSAAVADAVAGVAWASVIVADRADQTAMVDAILSAARAKTAS